MAAAPATANEVSLAAIEPLAGVAWKHLGDAQSPALDALAAEHGLHELDIEDCRHRRETAKVVEHGEYTFVVLKTVNFNAETMNVQFGEFDLFFKPDLLITVAEGRTGIVEASLRRLAVDPEFRHPRGIFYTLLDYAVDEYQPVLNRVGDQIGVLEAEVLEAPSPECLARIFAMKRMLIEFRRHTVAMRELVNHLLRTYGGPRDELYPYFRDVYDHLVRALDFAETYRDILTGVLDLYLSAVANRTNEIVKVLSIFGTVATPLLILTSFYGMNVDLPWQKAPHAWWYPVGGAAAVTLAMLVYMRWKEWF
jgi:magnesium transporter